MYLEGMEVLTFEEALEAEEIRHNAMYRPVNSVKKRARSCCSGLFEKAYIVGISTNLMEHLNFCHSSGRSG